MISTVRFGLVAPALALAAVAAPAAAQVTTVSDGNAIILNALSVTNVDELEFGEIIAGPTAGTVTINPSTNARTTTGGAIAAGSSHHRATFYAAGVINRIFIVLMPTGSTTLTNGTGQTMTVNNWTRSGTAGPLNLGPTGVAVIYVGGRLNVGANQAPGVYTGTFDLTVIYV